VSRDAVLLDQLAEVFANAVTEQSDYCELSPPIHPSINGDLKRKTNGDVNDPDRENLEISKPATQC